MYAVLEMEMVGNPCSLIYFDADFFRGESFFIRGWGAVGEIFKRNSVAVVYINTMKTTFDFNFDFDQHGYIINMGGKKKLSDNIFSLFTSKLK